MNMCNASYLRPLVANHPHTCMKHIRLPTGRRTNANSISRYPPVNNFSHFYEGYCCMSSTVLANVVFTVALVADKQYKQISLITTELYRAGG